MIERNQDLQFIYCNTCNSSGIINNKTCSHCGGIGMGAFWEDQFIYFDFDFGGIAAKKRFIIKWLKIFIGYICGLIFFIGLISIIVWFIDIKIEEDFSLFSFWQERNILFLLFWLSLGAGMFLIYLLDDIRAARQRIPCKISKGNIPNNWNELKIFKRKLNIANYLSVATIKTLDSAANIASGFLSEKVLPKHLLAACLNNGIVRALFSRLSVNPADIAVKLRTVLEKNFLNLNDINLKKIIIESFAEAYYLKSKNIEPIHLIRIIVINDNDIAEILYNYNIDEIKIYNTIKWFAINEKQIENYRLFKKMSRYRSNSDLDKAYTAITTPVLNGFSIDLTRAAKHGYLELCVAREMEIKNIFEKFEAGFSGVILVGENGVGKNTIVGGIAELIIEEETPLMLKDKRLVELDIPRLMGGVNSEKAEERLLVVIDEIIRSGNIIIYIKNLEIIASISEGNFTGFKNIFFDSLEKKGFLIIASTNPENYKKYFEGKIFGEVFAKVEISEPHETQAIQIAESKIGFLENKYKIFFSYNAIEEAVRLSNRYLPEQYSPKKIIEILELAALRQSKKRIGSLISKEDIDEFISNFANIPVNQISKNEAEILSNLEEKIHKRIVGQKEAVKAVAESLRRARASLKDDTKPIASFLFVGPTGVGKTELAKAVASIYFGDEMSMIRLDMSEYSDESCVRKIIGGSEEEGYLTEAVRHKPFSLILFDEFEKAHPLALNLFLQLLDDGRLTDGFGRTIDFSNSIIIATSNAGAEFILEAVRTGRNQEFIKKTLIDEYLPKIFKPELLNRFDRIIFFNPLNEDEVLSIAKLMIERVRQALEKKGIGLELADGMLRQLLHEGFDKQYGARQLRRVLQDKLENAVASMIIAGKLERRDTVLFDENGKIMIRKGREL